MEEYTNRLPPPKDQPRRPAGVSYPVIIRLVLSTGSEEWRPAKTVRWTATAVMVGWESDPGNPRSTVHAWLPAPGSRLPAPGSRLPAADVRRVIRRPAG